MFKPAVGFKATLSARLTADAVVLPLAPGDVARVAALLAAPGDYTRLWVGDGVRSEVVRVTGVTAGAVVIDRAQEGSGSAAFPVGTCVAFAWTESNLADFINGGLGGRQPSVCSIKAGSDRVSVTTSGCEVTVDSPECPGASWRSGNMLLTQSAGGCITQEPVGAPIPDGEYQNATIVVRDGQITAVRAGTNIVYSGGGCCGPSEAQA